MGSAIVVVTMKKTHLLIKKFKLVKNPLISFAQEAFMK